MKLLIALPCFNEAEKIAQVLTSIPRTYEGFDFVRLLVVDDGSADDTARLAFAAGATVIPRIPPPMSTSFVTSKPITSR